MEKVCAGHMRMQDNTHVCVPEPLINYKKTQHYDWLMEFKLAKGPWVPTSLFGIHRCTGKLGCWHRACSLKLQLDHLVKLLHFPKWETARLTVAAVGLGYSTYIYKDSKLLELVAYNFSNLLKLVYWGSLGRTTCTLYSISAQTIQESNVPKVKS